MMFQSITLMIQHTFKSLKTIACFTVRIIRVNYLVQIELNKAVFYICMINL